MADPRDAFPQLDGGSVVTVGTFDGVHRGHRDIVRTLVERGEATRLPTLLVTFRPHPLAVINPASAPKLLTPGDEQLEALADTGVDHVVLLPFTRALAEYTAHAFVEELLLGRYHMREMIVGYDHTLGRGREGTPDVLRQLSERLGFKVTVVPPTLDAAGAPISSTVVRAAVTEGELDRARELLGRPYGFRGIVTSGSQRGRDLGYPTLNIALDAPRKLLPPDGVYAVRATTPRGEFGGMMNLGGRPTFGELERVLEVHLFDATGDWYGLPVSVAFLRRLRDTMRFDSLEALVEQLAKDAETARRALTQA